MRLRDLTLALAYVSALTIEIAVIYYGLWLIWQTTVLWSRV